MANGGTPSPGASRGDPPSSAGTGSSVSGESEEYSKMAKFLGVLVRIIGPLQTRR